MRNLSLLGLLLLLALSSSFTLFKFPDSSSIQEVKLDQRSDLSENFYLSSIAEMPEDCSYSTTNERVATQNNSPQVDLSFQPMENNNIVYQPVAARRNGQPQKAQLSIIAYVRNKETENIKWTGLRIVYYQNGKAKIEKFKLNKTIKPGNWTSWQNSRGYNEMGNVIQFTAPFPAQLTFIYEFENRGVVSAVRNVVPYRHPTPSGHYLFPFHAKDFEADEYVEGQARHGGGGQVFALDLGVVKNGKSSIPGGIWYEQFEQVPGNTNESYRCFTKPIYSMTEGEVYSFVNDMPENPHPCAPENCGIDYSSYDKPKCAGGCGNHFIIKTADEYIFYGHLKKGTLNKNLMKVGAKVHRGQFLGQIGNSGTSYAPHLHIDVQKKMSGNQFFRPMLFEGAKAMAQASYSNFGGFFKDDSWPWVELNGSTISEAKSIIKPSNFVIPSLAGRKVAVFRKSTAEEQAIYGVDYQTFRRKYDEIWKDGWRLHLLENHVKDKATLYTAVWRKAGKIAERQVYGWSYTKFRKRYDELWKSGYRLHILNNYVVNGEVKYTAVWRKVGRIAERQVYGWSYSRFRKRYDQLWKSGYRLHILNNYVVNGQTKYTAVWRKIGAKAERQVYGWNYKDFRKRYDELWKQGYRLHILNNYVINGQVKYTAVWRKPGKIGEVQLYGWNHRSFMDRYEELRAKNMRLHILNIY